MQRYTLLSCTAVRMVTMAIFCYAQDARIIDSGRTRQKQAKSKRSRVCDLFPIKLTTLAQRPSRKRTSTSAAFPRVRFVRLSVRLSVRFPSLRGLVALLFFGRFVLFCSSLARRASSRSDVNGYRSDLIFFFSTDMHMHPRKTPFAAIPTLRTCFPQFSASPLFPVSQFP